MALSMRRLAVTGVLLGALIGGPGLADTAFAGPKTFNDGSLTRGLTTRNIGPQAQKAAKAANQWAHFKVTVRTDKPVYRIGDLMNIKIYSDRNAYLMVYYINSEGKSSVICPSPFSRNNRILAGKPFLLRDNKGHMLKQYGPPGTETIQVVATEKPLDVNKIVMASNGKKPATVASATHPKKPAAVKTKPAKAKPAKAKPAKAKPKVQKDVGDDAGMDQSATESTAGTSGGESYDQYGNPVPGSGSAQASSDEGGPTEVQQPQQFVNDTSGLIRSLVRKRSTEIAKRYRNISAKTAFAKKDSVYGLASTSYRVVKH